MDTSINNWIKLNVGGFRFETTAYTLTKEDSMLSRMVTSEIPVSKDEDGCMKIDRSGKHFNEILDYLRSGMFPTFKSIKDAVELRNEADYYLIDELRSKCENFIDELKNASKRRTILVKEFVLMGPHNRYYEDHLGRIDVNAIRIPVNMDGSISLSHLRMAFPSATGLCQYRSPDFSMLPIVGESIQLPEDYQESLYRNYYVLPKKFIQNE